MLSEHVVSSEVRLSEKDHQAKHSHKRKTRLGSEDAGSVWTDCWCGRAGRRAFGRAVGVACESLGRGGGCVGATSGQRSRSIADWVARDRRRRCGD